jgi:hypothetical protein
MTLPKGWTQQSPTTFVYNNYTFSLKVELCNNIFQITAESEGYGSCCNPGYYTEFEIPAEIIDQLKLPKSHLARDFPVGTKFKKDHFEFELIGYSNIGDQIVITEDLQGTVYTQNINDLLPYLIK